MAESKKQTVNLKVGELLKKEGFVQDEDIQKALELQENEISQARLPVEQYMLNKKYLTKIQFNKLKEHPEYGTLPADQLAYKLNIISKKNLDEIQSRRTMQRSIGEILCEMGAITTNDLNYILQKYSKHQKFGEILLRQEYIDEVNLNVALREQTHRTDPLGKILVQKKFITVDQLYQVLSKQYNIPYRKLEGFVIYDNQIDKLINIVGYRYAKKHMIIPLMLEANTLTLAVSSPERLAVVHELAYVYTHLKLKCIFISEEKFDELFEILYGIAIKESKADADNRSRKETVSLIDIDLGEDVGDARDSKSANLYGTSTIEAEEVVNFIIKYGIVNNASDIHIEQNRKKPRIRYRIDGILQTLKLAWLDERINEMIGAIISRIKVISNLDIAERRMPQDGVFRVNYYDREKKQTFDLDFRVATCPAIIGENVTLRILDSRNADVGLEYLNHSAHVLEPFKAALKSSAGMVLVSGPTGSGKTSTLYGALMHINHPGIKIITAEDPIEYSFPDIMQTQIKPKINLTFAKLLRSFLRFDPDIILVGEMRDKETASIGFDAALTGHLLLSTIHTNDAVSAVTRLLDLGIEYNQMASSLMAVLAQRLVRTICPVCKKEYTPKKEEWVLLFEKYPEHLTFYTGEGCEECKFTGYKGRTLISEIFVVDRNISLAMNRGESENEIRRIALKEGMKTMLDDGIMKLDQTTLDELIRVVPHEMLKEFKTRK
ncbi:MAG: type II/IV secretion system protein [Desulfobacteraceae bacterium]|nr:MAG: type II/IV secretion system protein [Desulfobacteraceae bacterium]